MRGQRSLQVVLVLALALTQLGMVDPTPPDDAGGDRPTVVHAGSERRFVEKVEPGAVFASVRVRGTESSIGQSIQVAVVDPQRSTSTLSAQVPLQPWWQTVGVSAVASGQVVQITFEEVGLWDGGDRYEVADLTAVASGATQVTTSGRQMLVDGAPYLMKGISYNPVAVGGTTGVLGWQTNPTHCQTDANLMAAAGINTIRIQYAPNPSSYDAEAYRQCLDAFHAAGVGAMWLIQPPGGAQWQENHDAYVDIYWEHLRVAVENVKDHPATLGYGIGNEIKRTQPQSNGWFPQVDELARRTKLLDPLHVTTTSLASNQFYDSVGPGVAPNIDLWAINKYGYAYGYPDTMWQHLIDQDPTRPIWFSEFGTDRYHCAQIPPRLMLQTLNLIACEASGSGEDPQAKADWDAAAWEDIAANTSATDPDGAVVGGTLFMWADVWWFALAIFTGTGTQATHDVSGINPVNPINGTPNNFARSHFPDGHVTPEWFGINHAMRAEQTGPRVTTITYDRMAGLFSGAPVPVVSGVTVTPGACSATLRWNTDVPTFARVDYGLENEVTDGNIVHSENFVADQVIQHAVAGTVHEVEIGPLVPGVPYLAHVRGFDGNGRAGTALGVRIVPDVGACG